MKKISLILPLLFLFMVFMISCKKDGNLTASPVGNDPFIRTDNPNSLVDHKIYEIFQQIHLPILYSDTVDKDPLFTIDVNYHLTGANSTIKVDYIHDTSDILTGIDFVRDQFLRPLADSLRPYSVLLVDSLLNPMPDYASGDGTIYIPLNACSGLNTFAIANIPRIKMMTADSLKRYKASVFSTLLLTPLNKNNVLDDFYSVSAAYYGKYVYLGSTGDYYLPYLPKEDYGLIPYGNESTVFYPIGTQNDDLAQYLNTVLTTTKEEFMQEFGTYPLIMTKYNYLVNDLAKIGFNTDSL